MYMYCPKIVQFTVLFCNAVIMDNASNTICITVDFNHFMKRQVCLQCRLLRVDLVKPYYGSNILSLVL